MYFFVQTHRKETFWQMSYISSFCPCLARRWLIYSLIRHLMASVAVLVASADRGTTRDGECDTRWGFANVHRDANYPSTGRRCGKSVQGEGRSWFLSFVFGPRSLCRWWVVVEVDCIVESFLSSVWWVPGKIMYFIYSLSKYVELCQSSMSRWTNNNHSNGILIANRVE